MTIKEKFEQLQAIYAKANADAAPIISELKPYLAAADAAAKLNIPADASATDIIDAFANSVDFQDMPEHALVPYVLAAGAPEEIHKAGQEIIDQYKTIGATVGKIAGVVLSMR